MLIQSGDFKLSVNTLSGVSLALRVFRFLLLNFLAPSSWFELLLKSRFLQWREKLEIKALQNSKAFIDYSQSIDDVYKNLEDYNLTKKRWVLIEFDDMIADIESNKMLSTIVTEIVFSLVFISQSYFKVPKTIRLNGTRYFIMKIPNKRELQQIASNHSIDIGFKDFMKLYKNYTKEPCSFLKNRTTLLTGNPLRFRKNLLRKWVLVRKSKQSITKLSWTKLNKI